MRWLAGFQVRVALLIVVVALGAVVATVLATSPRTDEPERAPRSTVTAVAATLEQWGLDARGYPAELVEALAVATGHRIVLAVADGDTVIEDSQGDLVAFGTPEVAADAFVDPLRPRQLEGVTLIRHGVVQDPNSLGPAPPVRVWLDPPANEPIASTTIGFAALAAIAVGVLAAAYLLSRAVLRPVRVAVGVATDLAAGQRAGGASRSSITELRELDLALEELDALLAAAAERRRALIDDVAHEIRSPLTSALGHLRGVTEGYFEADAEMIEGIIGDLELLDRLVGDLRTATRAEQGELTLQVETFDLRAAVDEAVRASAPEHETAVEVDPIEVAADPHRLQQILRNLVGNASRFNPSGVPIEIRGSRDGQRVVVTVRDHGPGLQPGTAERIFERFYRADPARDRSQRSTGLGLTIARALARQHGGDLRAANHEGGGAVFTLELPLDASGGSPAASG